MNNGDSNIRDPLNIIITRTFEIKYFIYFSFLFFLRAFRGFLYTFNFCINEYSRGEKDFFSLISSRKVNSDYANCFSHVASIVYEPCDNIAIIIRE